MTEISFVYIYICLSNDIYYKYAKMDGQIIVSDCQRCLESSDILQDKKSFRFYLKMAIDAGIHIDFLHIINKTVNPKIKEIVKEFMLLNNKYRL
jgi:hypothetical protein